MFATRINQVTFFAVILWHTILLVIGAVGGLKLLNASNSQIIGIFLCLWLVIYFIAIMIALTKRRHDISEARLLQLGISYSGQSVNPLWVVLAPSDPHNNKFGYYSSKRVDWKQVLFLWQ